MLYDIMPVLNCGKEYYRSGIANCSCQPGFTGTLCLDGMSLVP